MKVLYFSFTKPSYLPSAALHTYLSGITGTFSAESRAGLQDTLQLRISSPSFFTYSSERKRQIPQQKVYYNNLYIQSAPCSSCFRRRATAMARSYHCSDSLVSLQWYNRTLARRRNICIQKDGCFYQKATVFFYILSVRKYLVFYLPSQCRSTQYGSISIFQLRKQQLCLTFIDFQHILFQCLLNRLHQIITRFSQTSEQDNRFRT